MEQARKHVEDRARIQGRILSFINGACHKVSGLEPRLVRYKMDGLVPSLVEAIYSNHCRVDDDGVLHWVATEQKHVWGFQMDGFDHLDFLPYLPEADELVNLQSAMLKLNKAAAKLAGLLSTCRAILTEEYGGTLSVAHAIYMLTTTNSFYNMCRAYLHGFNDGTIRGPWFRVKVAEGVSKEMSGAFLQNVLDAFYSSASLEIMNDVYSDYLMRKRADAGMNELLRYHGESGLANEGFLYGSKIADRLAKVVDEFSVLPYEARSQMHRDVCHATAMIWGEGTHVACYRNEADKKRGRVTLLPLARWVRSYAPVPDDKVQAMVNAMRVGDIEFVSDYPTIYDAYVKSGISSCMSYAPGNYEVLRECMYTDAGRPIHPVWCYAEHPVLRLAIIRSGGDIVARALVNMENKQFYRVYGDYALVAALTTAGYKEDSDYLDGITIRSRLIGGRHLLFPYVDGDNNYADVTVNDDDDVELYLCSCGEVEVRTTDGGMLYYSGYEHTCPLCDCDHDDDYTVLDEYGDAITEVCWSCYNEAPAAYDENGRLHDAVVESGTAVCELSGERYILIAMVEHEELGMVSISALAEWEQEQEEEDEE